MFCTHCLTEYYVKHYICGKCQTLVAKRDYKIRKNPSHSYFFQYEFLYIRLRQLENAVPIPQIIKKKANKIAETRRQIDAILADHKIIKINVNDQSLGGLLSILADIGEVEYLKGSKRIITSSCGAYVEIIGLLEEKYQSVKEKYEHGEYFSWPDADIFSHEPETHIEIISKSTPISYKSQQRIYTCKEFRKSNTYKHAGERQCYEVLYDYFGFPFVKARPFWLRNPMTGYPLEIDFYNEEYKLGFEYQEAHHEYNNNVRYRDKIKVRVCKILGIHLYHIPDTTDKDKLKQIITGMIEGRTFTRSGMTRKSRRKSI